MSTTTTDKPRPEIAVDGFPKRQSGFGRMITSADHKDIAKILMVGSGGFLFIAALEFFLMRLQLAIPENTFMEPVMFNRILSLYGATGHGGNGGPDLTTMPKAKEQAGAEEQVTNGGGGMPAFSGILSEEEISNVAAYVVEDIVGGK